MLIIKLYNREVRWVLKCFKPLFILKHYDYIITYNHDFNINKFFCAFNYLEKRKWVPAIKYFGASKWTGKTKESFGKGNGITA